MIHTSTFITVTRHFTCLNCHNLRSLCIRIPGTLNPPFCFIFNIRVFQDLTCIQYLQVDLDLILSELCECVCAFGLYKIKACA